MTQQKQIRAYCAKRDAAVSSTLDDFIKFSAEQGQAFSSRQIAEIAQHKMRTAIEALPDDMRSASKQWLEAHGYESWH